MFATQTELYCANQKALQKAHLTGKDNEMHLLILLFQMSAIYHFNKEFNS